MGDGTLLTLGAASALAIGTVLTRRGSRATAFPFLFRQHGAGTHKAHWRLPPEVIAAATGVPDAAGAFALVYVDIEENLRRAVGVRTLHAVVHGEGYINLDGYTVYGEVGYLWAGQASGDNRQVRTFHLQAWRAPELLVRRISDTIYGEPAGSSSRSPIRKAAIAKGEMLYHGTSAREDFTFPVTPAWFSQARATAEWFTDWNEAGPRRRILSFRAKRRISNLLLVEDAAELRAVMEHLAPYDPPEGTHDMADAVCQAGYAGWRIPGNYLHDGGDDILLCGDIEDLLSYEGVEALPRARRSRR